MAVPFRRVSKTRKRKRRTHYKINGPEIAKCSNCGGFLKPHRVCILCGFYKGKQVITKSKDKE